MKTNDKKKLNVILANKQYFDQKLIEIVQNLQFQNQSLSDAVTLKQVRISDLKNQIIASDHKISDLTALNATLKMKKKKQMIRSVNLKNCFGRCRKN